MCRVGEHESVAMLCHQEAKAAKGTDNPHFVAALGHLAEVLMDRAELGESDMYWLAVLLEDVAKGDTWTDIKASGVRWNSRR